MSPHVTPPVLLSPIKTGAASSRSTGSVTSTSAGLPTFKNRQHSRHGANLSSIGTSARISPGKTCNASRKDCDAATKKAAVASEGFHQETGEKAVGAIKRQRSSPHHTPRNGRKPAGAQQKADRCEGKTLAPKRKGAGESALISSSLSKCQRFPSAGSSGTSLGPRKLLQNPKERVS